MLLNENDFLYFIGFESSIKLFLSNNPPLSNKFPFSKEES